MVMEVNSWWRYREEDGREEKTFLWLKKRERPRLDTFSGLIPSSMRDNSILLLRVCSVVCLFT